MIRFHYFLWFLYWQISNIEHSTHIESFLRVFEEGNNLFMIFGTFLRYSIINLQKRQEFPGTLFCTLLHGNKYMLFAGQEVRIGKNCARGLEYSLRLLEKSIKAGKLVVVRTQGSDKKAWTAGVRPISQSDSRI